MLRIVCDLLYRCDKTSRDYNQSAHFKVLQTTTEQWAQWDRMENNFNLNGSHKQEEHRGGVQIREGISSQAITVTINLCVTVLH